MKNRPFHIGEYFDSKASQIVFSTNYLRLDNYLYEIGKCLSDKNYIGNVIIDLLLSNGNSTNRFIELYFDGSKFDLSKVKTIKPTKELELRSIEFYSSNPQLLENSTLNKAQKYLVKRGMLNHR